MKNHINPINSIANRALSLTLGLIGIISTYGVSRGASITGLFNTGVNAFGIVLPDGTNDPHYSVTGPLTVAVVTPRFEQPNDSWLLPPPGSAWICPLSANPPWGPEGAYTYRLTFDLTGLDPATASIAGQLASDNATQIYLNGTDTGFSNSGTEYSALAPFTITNGFLATTNTLEFRVTNGFLGRDNPTGLLVANLAGTAEVTPSLSIRLSEVELCWQSISNRLYGVEYRSDLTTNIWVPLYTNIVGNAGTTCVYDKITSGTPQRYYRVVLPGPYEVTRE